jgi:hypothetical protein
MPVIGGQQGVQLQGGATLRLGRHETHLRIGIVNHMNEVQCRPALSREPAREAQRDGRRLAEIDRDDNPREADHEPLTASMSRFHAHGGPRNDRHPETHRR